MKKTTKVLFTLLLVTSVMLCMAVCVSADSMYIKKIVSVVYDDSSSMEGDKYAYANYAMQAFAGMLNADDQLFITYMSGRDYDSNYIPEEIDLSAEKIQEHVDDIRSHKDMSSTPYTAVETAFEKLKRVDDDNPNTQYWLVIITDGVFNEYYMESEEEAKRILNKNFKKITDTTMPNGTNPQITFLSIAGAVAPDKTESIHVEEADNATEITAAMSRMVDTVSGRTRVEKNKINKLDEKTIQVSSTIPLLNIVVFNQKSSAVIDEAVCNSEVDIPVVRKASISYPGYTDLVGGTFLLGDSKNVIGAGTYDITFDSSVNLDNIIVLFEPALEMRMTITLNGKEISDYSELDSAVEGDVISISCKIYEKGTDVEIDPALMPPGTKFEVSVSENGKVVNQSAGKDMLLSDYVLHNAETEINSSVTIEGFNPIKYSVEFKPPKPPVVYSITADYGGKTKSVKLDSIATNKDMTVCFTVCADGTPITDPNVVKSLNPVITVSPSGNSGDVVYTNDGKIVYTPKSAGMTASSTDSFDVDVTCTLNDGTTATAQYTVLISAYEIFAIDATQPVKRTEWYGNQVSVSFYITKDGAKLDKSAVEKSVSVILNEEYSDLNTLVSVSADGTITITPYSDEQHVVTFWNRWVNWVYYFGLESKDVTVTLNHSFGSADSVIHVIHADLKYLILNVYLPLIIEILIVAAIIAYIIRYFTKARFASNGVLYVGAISYNRRVAGTHELELTEIPLNQYNKFKNLWNPFKELTVSANGVSITAAKGNQIICNDEFPWYSDGIRPKYTINRIESPKDVVNLCEEGKVLVIHEIKTIRVMEEQNRLISQDDTVYYFTNADITYVKVGSRQTEAIESATAFCYSTLQY